MCTRKSTFLEFFLGQLGIRTSKKTFQKIKYWFFCTSFFWIIWLTVSSLLVNFFGDLFFHLLSPQVWTVWICFFNSFPLRYDLLQESQWKSSSIEFALISGNVLSKADNFVPAGKEKDVGKLIGVKLIWYLAIRYSQTAGQKIKKNQEKLVKSNKSISRKRVFFCQKSIFSNFKNGQKWIFELQKSLKAPKMQFHEILLNFH